MAVARVLPEPPHPRTLDSLEHAERACERCELHRISQAVPGDEKVLSGGGVRRIHDKPSMRQVRACHVWLDTEFDLVDPDVVVLLGATAVQAVLGSSTRLRAVAGTVVRREGLPAVVAASHPSAALRAPDSAKRAAVRDEIRTALERARSLVEP